MAKGAELPINTVIILVLAAIVLIALVAMFISRMFASEAGMEFEKAWSTCCVRYCHTEADVSGEPTPANYDCQYGDTTKKLSVLAASKTSKPSDRNAVLEACGCPVT